MCTYVRTYVAVDLTCKCVSVMSPVRIDGISGAIFCSSSHMYSYASVGE